jgi:hypothetical protein
MVIVAKVYSIMDMSLHAQVNIKQSKYSNSCYVDYLHKFTFSFDVYVM